MQENKSRTDKWIRCPNCGHKLFKEMSGPFAISVSIDEVRVDSILETKCHSCKKIVSVSIQ